MQDIKIDIPVKSLDGAKDNYIRVQFFYDLGNCDNYYHPVERGYYASIYPLEKRYERGFCIETVMAYKGLKVLLKQVQKQTKRGQETAQQILNNCQDKYIDRVCRDNNLELVKSTETV